MRIEPIDTQKDLFAVNDVIDPDLIDRLRLDDLGSYKQTPQLRQEFLPRRTIHEYNGSVLEDISNNIRSKLPHINSLLDTSYTQVLISYWRDLPGFEMSTHIDNPRIDIAMQIYLDAPDENFGTVFYSATESDVDEKDDIQKWYLNNYDLPVRHTFKSLPNTGYLMFNNKLQAHGVPNIVEDKHRISCYCKFL